MKVFYFIQGWFRYYMIYFKDYYNLDLSWAIRKHIKEQIKTRIKSVDRTCYFDGYCKKCGCNTIALLMSDKSCAKPCYPKIFSKKKWKAFKEGEFYLGKKFIWFLEDNKFVKKDKIVNEKLEE